MSIICRYFFIVFMFPIRLAVPITLLILTLFAVTPNNEDVDLSNHFQSLFSSFVLLLLFQLCFLRSYFVQGVRCTLGMSHTERKILLFMYRLIDNFSWFTRGVQYFSFWRYTSFLTLPNCKKIVGRFSREEKNGMHAVKYYRTWTTYLEAVV